MNSSAWRAFLSEILTHSPALRRLVGDADGGRCLGEIASVDVPDAARADTRAAEAHHATAADDPGWHHRRGAGHARLGGRLVLLLAKEETASLFFPAPLPLVVVLDRVWPIHKQEISTST